MWPIAVYGGLLVAAIACFIPIKRKMDREWGKLQHPWWIAPAAKMLGL
jgi:hypothetical protein